MKMNKTLLVLSILTVTVFTLPVSCKKDKNQKPNNQGQQGNNNQNNGGYSNSTLYFRGTVNGVKTEWSQGNLSYRLKIRGGGTESACNETKEMMTAGFVLETFTEEERFYISFTGCSDLDVNEEYFGNCERSLSWLERETTFPVSAAGDAPGAYIKFKLPANGNTYTTAGGDGTVRFTSVKLYGAGTYAEPRYVATGTFSGSLVNLNNPADRIEIKDGAFRIYLGVCAFF